MRAYKLKFYNSFHIDAGVVVDGPSETYIHSDTLFSAIVSAARKFYDDDVAQKFLEPKALVLSSAFPFYEDEFFLPKPLNFYPKNLSRYEDIKRFKKLKFISLDIVMKIISGQNIDNYTFNSDYILNGCWRIRRNKDKDKIFDIKEIPHVIIDRVTYRTQIFYKSEVYFHKNAGLYFLVDVREDLKNTFETVLRFLADEGIGSDRTTGKGLFEIEKIENLNLPVNSEADYFYLLSLYSPSKEEFDNINQFNSFYEFTTRGGWVSNKTINRKSIRMFIEGSVLNLRNKTKPYGILHKVLDKNLYKEFLSYDVFRSGQAIFLPVTGGISDDN